MMVLPERLRAVPPRELRVVTRPVPFSYTDREMGVAEGDILPQGTICQFIGMRLCRFDEAVVYYTKPIATEHWLIAYVPLDALRPYDPQQDAETKKLERLGSGGTPQRCAP